MANVFLCGHGSWPTTGQTSGFCQMPKNTTFSVYTPVGRFLSLGQAQKIIGRAPDALTPDQVFSSYTNTPNLSLHACPEYAPEFHSAGAGVVMVGGTTMLQDLLDRYQGHDIHWCACRIRFGGLDTTQGGFNDDFAL